MQSVTLPNRYFSKIFNDRLQENSSVPSAERDIMMLAIFLMKRKTALHCCYQGTKQNHRLYYNLSMTKHTCGYISKTANTRR